MHSTWRRDAVCGNSLTKQTFIAALRECSNIDEVGWMTLCEKL
jgi:hypothetical protein